MPTNLTTTYLLPAILLNPVLFLHSLNTILSRILPPVLAAAATTTPPAQQLPFCHLGPSPTSPHLDMHVSDNLCWSYTVFMVFAQLLAFGRVSQRRQTVRDRKDALRGRKEEGQVQDSYLGGEGNGSVESNGGWKVNGGVGMNGGKRVERLEETTRPVTDEGDESDETDETTEEEEMIL